MRRPCRPAPPGTAPAVALALALAGVCATAACDGFSPELTGWWCALDYSSSLGQNSCTVAWTCENMDTIHVGAADDQDPQLRSYPRSVDCTSILAPTGGSTYSCACYEDQRHHTTFTDPTICQVYFARREDWFTRLMARAKDGCSWPALPR